MQKNKPERQQEMLDLLERHYDLVLVHGDPAFADFALTFPAAAAIAGKIRYTGFVVGNLPARLSPSARQDVVLVSAGGGAVGAPLLRAALAARPLTQQRDALWHVIAGPNLAECDFAALQKDAGDKLCVERFRPDFPRPSGPLPLSVSQAGYNTLMEILQARAGRRRAIRRRARDRADPIGPACWRSAAWSRHADDAGLTPALLAGGDRRARRSRRRLQGLQPRGAAATAEILHQAASPTAASHERLARSGDWSCRIGSRTGRERHALVAR